MVEANNRGTGEEEQKTFIEEPAILDKYKAAAVVTDRKLEPLDTHHIFHENSP